MGRARISARAEGISLSGQYLACARLSPVSLRGNCCALPRLAIHHRYSGDEYLMRLEIAVEKMATPTANKQRTVTRDKLLKMAAFYSSILPLQYGRYIRDTK